MTIYDDILFVYVIIYIERRVHFSMIFKTLGNRIFNIRMNKGLNKTQFGKLFGATGSLVNKWENHDIVPSENRLKQLAEFGGYDNVEELLYGKRADTLIPNKYQFINQNVRKAFNNIEEFNNLDKSDQNKIIEEYVETYSAGYSYGILGNHSIIRSIETEQEDLFIASIKREYLLNQYLKDSDYGYLRTAIYLIYDLINTIEISAKEDSKYVDETNNILEQSYLSLLSLLTEDEKREFELFKNRLNL